MKQTLTITAVCAAMLNFGPAAGGAVAQDQEKIAQGAKIYAAQKCEKCHSIAGKGAKKGPLDGVGSKLSEDEIRQWLVDAPGMTKKTKATRKPVMKSVKAPKEDIEALVAYMQSLKKG